MLRALVGGIVQPPHERGRPRLPLADVVFACVLKVYTGFSSRRVASDVRAAKDAGLIDDAPSHQTICRYLEDEALSPLLRALVLESASPLADIEHDFAVDSTGFSTCMYDRWFDEKYGRKRKRQKWVKAHAICGTNTHVITGLIVTDGDGADAPQLSELVTTTNGRFEIHKVTADKAYLSRRNLAVIDDLGAVPYIPFKLGTTGTGPKLWQKMWAFYQYRRDDFLAEYHSRSNVETVFSMIKRKFGPGVRSKMLVSQVNELLCKVIAHNLCVLVASIYELGIETEFWKTQASSSASPDADAHLP